MVTHNLSTSDLESTLHGQPEPRKVNYLRPLPLDKQRSDFHSRLVALQVAAWLDAELCIHGRDPNDCWTCDVEDWRQTGEWPTNEENAA
jgi:hypothetical protein